MKRPRTVVLGLCLVIIGIPAYLTWAQLARTVDARLRQGPLGNSVSIYAAPHTLTAGEAIEPAQVAAELRKCGYTESAANPAGHYRISGDQIEIYPGPQSFFRAEPARVLFRDGHIGSIVLIKGNEETTRYSLEPQLMYDLAGEQRQRRRFVHFEEIPKVLVDAVLSAEDKRFFLHAGIDPTRIVKAAYVNMRSGRRGQGGSTLTMQLARSLWLDSRKNWNRKVMESLITLVIEQRLSKKEIFEYYANEIYLGEYETFSIHGFGEAARIYLNKDISQITLAEAALLAGLVQRPAFFNPVKHPERGLARRNVVLALMRQNGNITVAEEKLAASSPSGISPATPERGDAPYFLTIAMDEFRNRLDTIERGEGSYRVYTTLDPGLQSAAADAVRIGVQNIDALLRKKRARTADPVVPQVALIALDVHTGRGESRRGRTQLRHQPTQSRAGDATAGLGFQTIRLCRRAERPNRRGILIHTFEHGGRRADHLSFREYGVRAG